jgi:hypothetical protein
MKPIPYKMHHPLVLKVRQIQIPYYYLLDNKDNAYPKRRRGGKNLNNILEHLLKIGRLFPALFYDFQLLNHFLYQFLIVIYFIIQRKIKFIRL